MEDNVVRAFSQEDVQRLTGISCGQLSYWDRTLFFVPSFADENRRYAFSRVYSFRDVACLQILNTLRNELRLSLPHLRDVKAKLAKMGDDLWAKTTLYVINRRVVFDNPETGQREEVVSGQGVLQIPLEIVRGNLEKSVRNLWRRDRSAIGKIQRKRGVASNQSVIKGTRISVAAIQDFAEEGYSIAQIKEQYPSLTERDIRAAIRHRKAA